MPWHPNSLELVLWHPNFKIILGLLRQLKDCSSTKEEKKKKG